LTIVRNGTLSRLAIALVAVAALGGIAGCGGDEESTPTTPVEVTDKPAKLPPGWRRHISEVGGFAIGVPPGWKVRDRAAATVMQSKGRLVIVSVTSDRTKDALGASLEDYALEAARRLRGLRRLRTGEARPFPSRYPAVAVRGRGVARTGIRERLLLVITRRPEIAAYAILVARNAVPAAARDARRAKRVIRSLTGRPVVSG
jgi:hypothetical protein